MVTETTGWRIMSLCVFCNNREPNYTPEPGVEFICDTCVQQLLKFDQDELRRGHKLATDLGYTGKARAIESYLIKEKRHGKPRGSSRKRINRKRVAGILGSRKKNFRRPKVFRPAPILQDHKEGSPLSRL